MMERTEEIKHFHLFAGAGGGALGFQRGHARVGRVTARFRCLGGVDVDPDGIRDFGRLVGVPGTVLDLFDAEQFRAWHGHGPPAGWREATAEDVRRAAGGECPDIVFTSPPCKGFSGLLNPTAAATDKYQALNGLTLRSIALTLQAFEDDLPAFVILENVPRIQHRGRPLLEQIVTVLRCHGYEVAETVHDCGVIGGLGQTRKRFLLVARLRSKIPAFLYEPPSLGLRTVGDVIGEIPLPDARGLAMHRCPRLQWKTWIRLALIPAGKDWRALQELNVVDGVLADLGIVPTGVQWHAAALGVVPWERTSGTVTGGGRPAQGAFAVQDPRAPRDLGAYQPYGVRSFGDTSATVTGQAAPGAGPYTIADPRREEGRFNNTYRVVRFDEVGPTVTGGTGPSAGGLALADPRATTSHEGKGKYRITGFDETVGAVIGASTTGNGAFAVADPRPDERRNGALGVRPWDATAGTVAGETHPSNGAFSVQDPRPAAWADGGRAIFKTAGHYGVVDPSAPSGAVIGDACHDNGAWSVADWRIPAPDERPEQTPLIVSLDGTWHRPFTTLELAALQGFPWQALAFGGGLTGDADARWRERIGNAVPPPAAAAVASVMGRSILAARQGITFQLSYQPIWVQPLAAALSLAHGIA